MTGDPSQSRGMRVEEIFLVQPWSAATLAFQPSNPRKLVGLEIKGSRSRKVALQRSLLFL